MNGILNIIKPPGMTSHDVVSYIRKITGIKKVGHTGTLDPGAAGILPICIGKATKIVDYIMNDKKNYICELTLGNSTDTYDKYGSFRNSSAISDIRVELEDFLKVLERFKGEIEQKPPAFSAVKINGVRSYELARKGMEVSIPTRKVTIYGINVLKFTSSKILMQIECSKGTYIRSICNDIGEMLGCGGYMSFLLRTATGNFNLKNCCTLDELTKDNVGSYLFGMDYALNLDSIYIDERYTNKLINGNSVPVNINPVGDSKMFKIYLKPDKFIGIGKVKNKVLKMEKLMV